MDEPTGRRAVPLFAIAVSAVALVWFLLEVGATALPDASRDVGALVTAVVCAVGAMAAAWYGAWALVGASVLVTARNGRLGRILAEALGHRAPLLVRRLAMPALGASLAVGIALPAGAAPALGVSADLDPAGFPASATRVLADAASPEDVPRLHGTGGTRDTDLAPTVPARLVEIRPSVGEKVRRVKAPVSWVPEVSTFAGAGAGAEGDGAVTSSTNPPGPDTDAAPAAGSRAPSPSAAATAPGREVVAPDPSPDESTDPSPDGSTGPSSTSPANATYVVAPGDCLWTIARAHGATTDAEIARAWPTWWEENREVIGADPDLIYPGQVLRIPASLTEVLS